MNRLTKEALLLAFEILAAALLLAAFAYAVTMR